MQIRTQDDIAFYNRFGFWPCDHPQRAKELLEEYDGTQISAEREQELEDCGHTPHLWPYAPTLTGSFLEVALWAFAIVVIIILFACVWPS